MAGLKKPSKKRDTTNPNTALVLFLVFFVLLSIGLGVWGYYGYAGQEKLRTETKGEKDKAGAAKLAEDFFRFTADEARLAAGNPVEANEMTFWKNMRDQILGDGGKFKAVIEAESQTALKKMRDDNAAALKGFDDGQGYKTTYKNEITRLNGELTKAQNAVAAAQSELADAKTNLDKLQRDQKDFMAKTTATIKKDHKAVLDAAKEKWESMKKEIETNKELQEKLASIGNVHDQAMEVETGKIRKLTTELNKLKEQIKETSSSLVPRLQTDPHALLLDISQGKTIWDAPLGKIAKVDLDSRQVVISIGSASGVREETTFNVFANSWKGHAEGQLKGTVEVIRVLDANTSLARITSLYDASGAEIPLNDRVRGRIEREAGNVLKAGDLLFNLTFGSHVFIAGVVHWNGPAALGAAGQMRALRDFMALLERQGVKIDGYVDLTDGKLVGSITPKTRYIVRGDSFIVSRKEAKEPKEEAKEEKEPAKEAKEAKDDKEAKEAKDDKEAKDGKEKDGKEKEGKEAKENGAKEVKNEAPATGEREQRINEAMLGVRNTAIEKGLFIISADNLANVIGYRRPRNALDVGVSGFRPTIPGASLRP
jgi:hypothetical protein